MFGFQDGNGDAPKELQIVQSKSSIENTMREWANEDSSIKNGTASIYFGAKGLILGAAATAYEGLNNDVLEPGVNYDPADAAYERGKRLGTVVDVIIMAEGIFSLTAGKSAVNNVSAETPPVELVHQRTKDLVKYEQWPENNGFLGNYRSPEVAEPGQVFSRIGDLNGSYASPPGTPFKERGLPSNYPNKAESLWEVTKPIKYEGGIASPWKDSSGMGVQYKLENTVKNLYDAGKIKPYGK